MKMSVKIITKENFEAEVLQSQKTVLIDFWATWCGPCQMLSPVVDSFAEENPDISVCKVNVIRGKTGPGYCQRVWRC